MVIIQAKGGETSASEDQQHKEKVTEQVKERKHAFVEVRSPVMANDLGNVQSWRAL